MPDTIKYNDNDFQRLMKEFKSLSTFEAVTEWDTRAQTEVDRIADVIQKLDTEITTESATLQQVKLEHSQKPFFKRVFGGNKQEKETVSHLEQCRQYKTTLEELATELLESIDFTPNSLEDKKVLLKELKLRKKELQAEKKNVNVQMQSIRTEARQRNTRVTNYGIRSLSKLATADRRNIRLNKEAALGPHEDAKAAIERQIIQLDRDILWIERFEK